MAMVTVWATVGIMHGDTWGALDTASGKDMVEPPAGSLRQLVGVGSKMTGSGPNQ